MKTNLTNREIKSIVGANLPKALKSKKKVEEPKHLKSLQMQLMMQKLAQLKEMEKQSKSLKTSNLVKGLQ